MDADRSIKETLRNMTRDARAKRLRAERKRKPWLRYQTA